MSLYFYDINESIEKEESVDNYKNLFLEYYQKRPTLNEALEHMYFSSGLQPDYSKTLIDSVINKVENFVDNNFTNMREKYPDITKEHAKIISSYTCEAVDKKYSPYKVTNSNLVKEDRRKGVSNVSKYVFLLLSSLRTLKKFNPNAQQKVLFRCIQTNVNFFDHFSINSSYIKGNKKTFWGFTSTTTDLDKAKKFLGEKNDKNVGTIFHLTGDIWGYDISCFNVFREDEIILEPERKYIIEEVKSHNAVTYVQCKIENSKVILDPKSINDSYTKLILKEKIMPKDVHIIWADVDRNIESCSEFFKKEKYKLHFFYDTPSCIQFFKENHHKNLNIKCIITCIFGNNYKNYGHPNGFQMIDHIKRLLPNNLHPFFVMLTVNPDYQECKDFGFDLIIKNNREEMQNKVINRIKNNILLYREPNLQPCIQEIRDLAKHFFDSFNKYYLINNNNWDKYVNRCFCQKCEPISIGYRGDPKVKYSLPIGWYRFGMKIKDEYINKNIDTSNWNIAYYGTNIDAAISIINNQRIMLPGELLSYGKILYPQNNSKPNVIYMSPSIIYAKLFSQRIPYNGRSINIAFQCRIKPGSYTINKIPDNFNGIMIDNNFSKDEIEWIVDKNSNIVPFGFLVSF